MFDVNNQHVIVAYRINPLINHSAGLYKTRIPHYIKVRSNWPQFHEIIVNIYFWKLTTFFGETQLHVVTLKKTEVGQ